MKIIDVLVKQANKEIEDGTILKIFDEEFFGDNPVNEFEFYKDYFYHKEGLTIEEWYQFDTNFLNNKAELVPPKEKNTGLNLICVD